ncbi:SurA N-terminal domain-containing protein [Streptosporangium subroseum]|uniref:SurA N-terminal domain-containing protein n=1 Tax=Streptosporangium subroseum TaxID=106412 RepID=UPI0030911589|nr:SurA N-terminal domain-containing protein [Streptosporangium subroseum]
MKSTRVRVILAVAAAGVALTACSPSQAGAAAIVGKDRISSGELNKTVQEYEAALAKANVSASQLQFPGSVPQVVLFQLATSAQRAKVAESKGITVTEAEIDQVISSGEGGAAAYEQQMLQQAVPPSKTREFTRASLLITKLMAKYGGGTDEAAIQKGQVQVIKDLQSVPITWNPRYGTINEQRSEQQPNLFVESARFGAVPAAPPAAPQQ